MQIDAATRVIYHNPAIQAARVMATYASGLKADLVSWWTLDETSGNRADSHGGNTLADANTVLYGTGVQGNAADFENTNTEYLWIADNASLSAGDIDFTLCAWVNFESTGNRALVGKWNVGNSNREYVLLLEGGSLKFIVSNDGTATTTAATAYSSTATWAFVVAWHDSTANTINLQVDNGTPQSEPHTTGVYDGAANFSIGAIWTGIATVASYMMDGLVDEVGLWKRVLTADERTFLYNSGNGRTYTDL